MGLNGVQDYSNHKLLSKIPWTNRLQGHFKMYSLQNHNIAFYNKANWIIAKIQFNCIVINAYSGREPFFSTRLRNFGFTTDNHY